MKKIFILFISLFFLCGCANQENPSSVTTSTIPEEITTTAENPTTTSISSTTIIFPSTSTTSTTELGTTISSSTTLPINSSVDLTWGAKPTIALKLNKDTFHSGDMIRVDVTIVSKADLYNVEVRGYGIFAGRHYWLNKSEVMDLKNGTNNVTFYYTTPPCNKCAGIAAGTYTVEADIIYMNKALAHDIKTVSLIQ